MPAPAPLRGSGSCSRSRGYYPPDRGPTPVRGQGSAPFPLRCRFLRAFRHGRSHGGYFGSTEALDMVMDAYRPFLSYPGAFVLGSNDYYSPIPKRWSRYLSRSKLHPARVVPDLPYLPMVRELVRAGWPIGMRRDPLRSRRDGVTTGNRRRAYFTADRRGPAARGAGRRLDPGRHRTRRTRACPALASAGSDLILAGHTHGGQIGIPAGGAIITNCDIARRYAKGLNRWEAPDGAQSWPARVRRVWARPPTRRFVSRHGRRSHHFTRRTPAPHGMVIAVRLLGRGPHFGGSVRLGLGLSTR